MSLKRHSFDYDGMSPSVEYYDCDEVDAAMKSLLQRAETAEAEVERLRAGNRFLADLLDFSERHINGKLSAGDLQAAITSIRKKLAALAAAKPEEGKGE